MEYILGDKPQGCIFCAFPAKGPTSFREDLVLVAEPHGFVCLNRYPFTSCHLLVVPRRHVSRWEELPDDEYASLQTLVRAASTRLFKATGAQGMNVGWNFGKPAGAGIAEHLHAHLVPRWEGDSNFMPVVADVRVMPEYLDDAWRRLHPFFADLPGERAPSP